jgi:hypothetical protein
VAPQQTVAATAAQVAHQQTVATPAAQVAHHQTVSANVALASPPPQSTVDNPVTQMIIGTNAAHQSTVGATSAQVMAAPERKISARALLTRREKRDFRDAMRRARTHQERQYLREQLHATLRQRASDRGVVIAEPSVNLVTHGQEHGNRMESSSHMHPNEPHPQAHPHEPHPHISAHIHTAPRMTRRGNARPPRH